MHTTITEAEYKAFLLSGTRTAKVATVRANGQPHVTPVWFVLDGDDLLFTTHESYVMTRRLRRDPHVSIVVDDQEPPYSYVIVEGTVTLSDDLDELVRPPMIVAQRYMGADRAEEFGKRNGVPGAFLVRVTPTKVIAGGYRRI